ncbi:MAG: YraN family protein [Campylobacterales bacterium]|nr:YraN family protein [Campylobacterales bacterium]
MSREKGNIAEEKAVEYLKDLDFKILERNFYIKGGEIDIIAIKDEVVHFVEVKSGENFDPVFNITPKKISRVIKTAQLYLKKNSLNRAFCIDALIIKNSKIDFIENITL